MGMHGLHKLTGAVFVHQFQECAVCENRRPRPGFDFDLCTAKGKKICCPPTKVRRRSCTDFRAR